MFNLFDKKQAAATPNYPEIVHEIHNEFFTAGDKILQRAKDILNKSAEQTRSKGNRLAALGFSKSPEAVTAINFEQEIITTKEAAALVQYYQTEYPLNKFIIEPQLQTICRKYGLVCGDVSLYKGFVPESKIAAIESFKVKSKDEMIEVWSKGVHEKYKHEFLNDGGRSAIQWSSLYKKVSVAAKLKICAPLKDMEVTSRQEVVDYKIKDIPDPVVLQPVKGGYLIVAAWGNEASDEIVVNEIQN